MAMHHPNCTILYNGGMKMDTTMPAGVVELAPEECTMIEGGSPLPVVRYLAACFAAGFEFGFNELGPALVG